MTQESTRIYAPTRDRDAHSSYVHKTTIHIKIKIASIMIQYVHNKSINLNGSGRGRGGINTS